MMSTGSTDRNDANDLRYYCLGCGYLVRGDLCSECGNDSDQQIRENLLDQRRSGLLGIHRLIMIAVIIEVVLILVTFLAPSLRVVPMQGSALGIVRIGFDLLLTITPGILAAIATMRVVHGPWKLPSPTTVSLRAACLLFLTHPACQALSVVWYFNPTEMLFGILEWGYSMQSIALLAGTTILIRGLGICSRQDPGGAERRFLQHAWIGALALGILYETTMLTLGRIWSNMAATGAPQNLGMDAILLVSRALVGGFILYVLIWVVLLNPWKRMLKRCNEEVSES